MTAETDVRAAGEALLRVDHHVHRAAESQRASTPVRVLATLSEIGDQPQLRLLCGGLVVVGLVRGDPRMIVAGTRMLLSHELATATKTAIKNRIDRRRPRSAASRHEEKPRAGDTREKEESSFPSGHSAGAMAVASALARTYPEHRPAALLTAGAVALAQIPRCAHYPTDVGAGLAIGAAADGTIALAGRLLRLIVAALARRG